MNVTIADLRARGLALCKPDLHEKNPLHKGWSAGSLEPGDYSDGDQVGIVAGPLSNCGKPGYALVILDLDTEDALREADQHLPPTAMMEGRASKPRSHRYYLVPVATIPTWAESHAEQASKAAKEQTGHPGPFLKPFPHRKTRKEVIRFLGTGGQCVAPPSVHPMGEIREWEGGTPGEPAVVEFLPLWEAVCTLASVCECKLPEVLPRQPKQRIARRHRGTGDDPVVRAGKYLAKMEASVSGCEGHKALFAAARAMAWGFNLGIEVSLNLIHAEFNPRCEPQWSNRELQHKVEDADRIPDSQGRPRGYLLDAKPAGGLEVPPATNSTSAAPNEQEETKAARPPIEHSMVDDNRPTIIIGTDEWRVNAEAINALAESPNLFQRGGMLTHIIQSEEPAADAILRRPSGAPVIRFLPPPLLRERLTRYVQFIRRARDPEGNITERPEHPPMWSVSAIDARGTWPGIFRLDAVVSHPVILPDGSILTETGYDQRSRLFVSVPSDLQISVPELPSRGDVSKAVEVIKDLVSDFPFERPVHQSVWVAGLLTPIVRYCFVGPVPMLLIDKNVRGAGAGLLADVIALTLTGRRFPVMPYTPDREELRKRITSVAMEGEQIVLLDNLSGPIGNDILDAALTTDRWKDRVLGVNKTYDGPLSVCWYATGNNVQLQADTSRRCSHCKLHSDEERPEVKRGFKYSNLRDHVQRHRGEILSAALTIAKGWYVAGRPKHNLTPWGSFEGWSDVVREMVVFAGLDDPGESRMELQGTADVDAATMTAVIDALARMDPGRDGKTTAEIIDAINKYSKPGKSGENIEQPPAWHADLKSAVGELCGRLDGKALGYKLRHFQKRNFGGRMIDKASATGRTGAARWVVCEAKKASNNSNLPGGVVQPGSQATDDAGDTDDVLAHRPSTLRFGSNDRKGAA